MSKVAGIKKMSNKKKNNVTFIQDKDGKIIEPVDGGLKLKNSDGTYFSFDGIDVFEQISSIYGNHPEVSRRFVKTHKPEAYEIVVMTNGVSFISKLPKKKPTK